MILIWRQTEPAVNAYQAIAMFGIGLIGRAILHALKSRGMTTLTQLPVEWNDAAQRIADLDTVTKAIHSGSASIGLRRVDIVWAAGKAGFGAGRDQLASEIQAFNDVSEWARRLASALPHEAAPGFHMLSSAGGLFEGVRFVERRTPPQPSRAYGEAKLEQEASVERLRADMVAYVYRPSSVYGFNGPGGRSGLVNTLIANAMGHNVSRIFGGLDTVRDYVLVDDIGEFIAKKIIRPVSESNTFLLASGKPTSVSEIAQVVSKVLGRSLYLKLDVRPSNASHITFRQSALPQDWRPTDLETGIRLVARQLSTSLELGSGRH